MGLFDGLFDRVIAWANSCEAGATADQIREIIEDTETALNVAEHTATFLNVNRNATTIIGRARTGLSHITSAIGTADDLCNNILAVRRIQSAVNVLNQRGIIASNPQAATEAFSNLFLGLGTIAEHLPPPANAYAQILTEAGNGFFENMRRQLDPAQRWGDEFRQIEEARGPNVRGMQR